MARPRSFDEDTVLTAAMHAFRRDGFRDLSVASLEQATGLRASSLYNGFGDKAGLFRRSLDHYVSSFVGPRLESYAGPEATLEDLEQLFLTLFEPPLDDGFGCLVTNTAVEQAPGGGTDPLVRACLDAIGRHLDLLLEREVGDTDDAPGLTLLYQGLLVFSRAGLITDRHRAAVESEFARLRARREQR